MSVQAMSWVFDHSHADLGARLVLLSIANHADKYGGESWPSSETIADEVKLSTRQVSRCLTKLEGLGELFVFAHVKRVGVRGSKNMYGLPLMPTYRPPDGLSPRQDNMSPSGIADDQTSATRRPDILDIDDMTSSTKIGGCTTSLEPSLEPSIEPSAHPFEEFWDAYPKRRGQTRGPKQPTIDKWVRMSTSDRALAMIAIPIYTAAIDPGYYVDAKRFLTLRIFDDYQHAAPKRPAGKTAAEMIAERAARAASN